MFNSIEELTVRFKWEMEMTGAVLDRLTDQSLAQSINDDHRTIGRIAWHIVTTYPEMAGGISIPIEAVSRDSPMPGSAKEIADAYKGTCAEVIDFVSGNWTDETLKIEDTLYGLTWPRGKTIMILLFHEVHHRGQLTVLMRQAGLVVPSIYGPAKEGWSEMGQPAPQI